MIWRWPEKQRVIGKRRPGKGGTVVPSTGMRSGDTGADGTPTVVGKDLQRDPACYGDREMEEQLPQATNQHRLWREDCSFITAHAAFLPLAGASLRSCTHAPGVLPLGDAHWSCATTFPAGLRSGGRATCIAGVKGRAA